MSQDVELPQLHTEVTDLVTGAEPPGDLRRLADVPVQLSVEIGRTRMTVGETLDLHEGSVITLERMADEAVDLLVNGTPIAQGEVVVIDEQFGLRLTKLLGSTDSVRAGEPAVVDGEPVPPAP